MVADLQKYAPRTEVLESYWMFAAERLQMYYRRLEHASGPWTHDPILRQFRFTNTFRAADRVSQFLVRDVQYRSDRSQQPSEVFFRTILFKLFNRIETWELLERELGPLNWQSTDLDAVSLVLDRQMALGHRVYSAAYIMPPPALGHARKHANHIALVSRMMRSGLPANIARAQSLRDVYALLLDSPGIGPFLAFQYAVDLNYSTIIDFDENDFVVAGPGALDGISKCFSNADGDPANIIRAMAERQQEEFEARGLRFNGLFGRAMKLIDCQNVFCELSKYARVAHANVRGVSGRTQIKQRYDSGRVSPVAAPYFPPKWDLNIPETARIARAPERAAQLQLQF